MSYLLDALRKSEFERNARQGTDLAGKVVVPAGRGRNRSRWLLPFVLVILLINLGGLAWFILQEPPPESVVQDWRGNVAPTDLVEPVVEKGVRPGKSPAAELPRAAIPSTSGQDFGREVAGGAEMTQVEIKPQPAETDVAPKVRRQLKPVVPAVVHGQLSGSDISPPGGGVPEAVDEPQSGAALSQPKPSRIEAVLRTAKPGSVRENPKQTDQPSPEQGGAGGSEIPSLASLPDSFRRNLPSLSVNVFVHADNQAQSFVVINMNKYRPGDTLREGMLLEAINPEDMVMVYEGRRFRFPRP